MEWVETTARTVEEAKDLALDQLGVAADDAEFEVLDEPKPGLFGRLRGEARFAPGSVPRRPARRSIAAIAGHASREGGDAAPRAAEADGNPAAPKSPAKPRQRAARDADADAATADAAAESAIARSGANRPTPAPREHNDSGRTTGRRRGPQVRRRTGRRLRFTGTTELIEDGDDLEVRVHGENLGLLVGPRGTTLQAVQDLARSPRSAGSAITTRGLRVDIGGYRERRKEALDRFAVQMADEVKQSGVARVLEPMSSADRKIIHDALSEVDGVSTRSEGDDPYRRVVIAPAND